jgi:hypothetical protein
MAINPTNCLDNHWVSAPLSNNHPTLLDVTWSWTHWHLSMKRKRYFGNAIQTILPMQTIFDPQTPSLLGIKFREMIVKGGATNLGTIFSNTNMRMSKQTFPNSYTKVYNIFQKLGKEHKVNQGFPMDSKVFIFPEKTGTKCP